MIKYFVAYSFHSEKQSGNGCIEITLESKVSSYDDIKAIINYLNDTVKDNYGEDCKCAVLNYKEFPSE